MPSTLIKGKYVLCKVSDQDMVEAISDGAVFQKDGEIIDVGKYDTIKARYTADEEIGSDQHMVLPGLVNAHQHGKGVSYILMGTLDDNLEPWLIKLMERKPVDQYLDTMYCIARLIESGVTTVMHSHSPRNPNYEEEVMSILKAYQDGGIRVALALGVRNQNHLVYQDDQKFLNSLPPSLATRGRKHLANIRISEEEYFALFDRLYKEYGGNTSPKVRILHGPTAPQWCSDELLIRIKQSADKYQTGVHAHLLETMYQKMYAFNSFGKTFVEHLNDIGFLGEQVSFAHCVWLTERDIELLAQSGVSVCHNPSSNLRLKSGIAPVNRMLDRGINVALGMDGSAINDDEDMLQELRLCANLHRIPGLAKPSPTPGQLLKMATVNGAKVTLFSNKIGTLERGKKADIILVNLKNITEPYLDPEIGIVNALLSRGKGSDVDTVMIDGEIVLRNRKHTRINRGEIVAGLRESLSRAIKPSDIERRQLARELYPYIYQFYHHWQESETSAYSAATQFNEIARKQGLGKR
jgi:5-methylthioadenosine/S-adenosylhomocysteine deaminase